jgi:predicted transglutaminase-like cysteine proteinase
MRRLGASGIISLVILFLAKSASGQELAAVHPEPPADPSAAFMRVYGSTEPPPAFVHFCEEYPEECAPTSRAEGRVPASPKLLTELDQVNGRIN